MSETKKYVTSEEPKTHNKSGDLWISIQGKVYDVSNWGKDHPGGEIPLLAVGGNDVQMHLLLIIQFLGYFFSTCSIYFEPFSANVYVGKPRGNDWFEKQTNGSIDIDCPTWMDWLFGGLQFQLEHHMFPRLPRCNLRKIAPVVRDLCKKHK